MEINANHINIYCWHTVISLYDSFYKTHYVFYEEKSLTICVPIISLAKNREEQSLIKFEVNVTLQVRIIITTQ